jgi:hypothetical protein
MTTALGHLVMLVQAAIGSAVPGCRSQRTELFGRMASTTFFGAKRAVCNLQPNDDVKIRRSFRVCADYICTILTFPDLVMSGEANGATDKEITQRESVHQLIRKSSEQS